MSGAGSIPSEKVSKTEHRGILISDQGIFELHGKRITNRVLRADIEHIRLEYTTKAHNPAAEGIIGGILTVCGLWGLVLCLQSFKGGRYYILLVALGLIGVSMLWDVFQRRYVLLVSSRGHVKKLSFAREAELEGIRDFVKQTRDKFGLQIEEKALGE